MDGIQDSVLGTVHLDEPLFKALVDTAEFQRLRHIAQLGPAELVFPTAHHSRFSHSLGVYELTRRLCEHLPLSTSETRTVLAAALLHDIGHFPLSHTVEAAYTVESMVAKSGHLGGAAPDGKLRVFEFDGAEEGTGDASLPHAWIPPNDRLLQFASDAHVPDDEETDDIQETAHHERLSGLVCRQSPGIVAILNNYDVDPAKVEALINYDFLGKKPGPKDYLLGRIVKSEFDMDRLDYLLRDSETIGTTYGRVEVSRLLEKYSYYEHDNGLFYPVIDEEAIPAMDHFLVSRSFAYEAIIFHRAVCCFDVLGRAAYLLMLNHFDDLPRNTEQMRSLASGSLAGASFLSFTDHMFWRRLAELLEYDKGTLEHTVARWMLNREQPREACCLRIARRKQPIYADEPPDVKWVEYEQNKTTLQECLLDVASELGIDPSLVFHNEARKGLFGGTNYDWTPDKGLADGTTILVSSGVGLPAPLEAMPQSMMRTIGSVEIRTFRVYGPTKDEAVALGQKLRQRMA